MILINDRFSQIGKEIKYYIYEIDKNSDVMIKEWFSGKIIKISFGFVTVVCNIEDIIYIEL